MMRYGHAAGRKIFILLIFILLIMSGGIGAVYGEAVSSKELIDNTREMDGDTIVYTGEAVTAVMDRGKNSWINLNDGDNAIGIWCERSLTEQIVWIGNYKNRGDIVEVEGVFNCACPVHNGEPDIHAYSLKIIKTGYVITKQFNMKMVWISAALLALTLIVAVVAKNRK